MVMGPTHAVSGAALWLGGSWAAAELFGYHQSPTELVVGTAVCAGAALLPDLDCSGAVLKNRGGATVAHTFGIFSLFLSECVEKMALGVYMLTRGRHDPKRSSGHRTLTHTWIFNVLLGLGVAQLCQSFGRTAAVAVLFVMFGLAIRGLMADAAKKSGWVLVTVSSAGAAYWAINELSPDRGYPLLGLAVGVGGVIHTLGDMITKAGCPILWPIPLKRGEFWVELGLPDAIALRAGSPAERLVVRPVLIAAAVVAGAVILAPTVARGWWPVG